MTSHYANEVTHHGLLDGFGRGLVTQEDQIIRLEGCILEPAQLWEVGVEIEFSQVASDLISHCNEIPIKTLDTEAQQNFPVSEQNVCQKCVLL